MKKIAPLFLLALLLPRLVLGAFSSATQWEVRTSASATDQGCGFAGANLPAPSAPSVSTATTGGTVAAGTYYVAVVYVDAYGKPGKKSAESSITTTGATSTITTTSPSASSGVYNYRVFMGTVSGGPYWANPGTDVAVGTNSVRTTTPATSGTQPAGTDYSQQASHQHAYTDIVIGNPTTTTITSAARPFVPADVGNVIDVASGTGFTVQKIQITAVDASNVATIDKSAGTAGSTGGTGKFGGACQTISAAALVAVAGNTTWIEQGTYNETLATNANGGNASPVTYEGYASTRGDRPKDTTRPLIDAQSTRANAIDSGNSNNVFKYLRVANGTGTNISVTLGGTVFQWVKTSGSAASGMATVNASGGFYAYKCEASGNSTFGFGRQTGSGSGQYYFGCYSHDNSGSGIANTIGGSVISNVIVESNAGHGIIATTGLSVFIIRSTVYGNTGASSDGLNYTGTGSDPRTVIEGNVFASNGRYGLTRATSTATIPSFGGYNLYYGNSTAPYINIEPMEGDQTSVDPGFVDAANADFRLGSAAKNLGWPGTMPGMSVSGYADPGALEEQCAAGGGGCSSMWGW